ncbi:septal ring lytic transglycosylase RlpA family protein [Adhaeribacter swui]|uniref:Probable endolytic peptidoglycan transglycosylase RlpA n=1 Tax=Adhaeribacter swui TaxID=2086471 RepID=A0A7G7G6I6_9BACT|nr:septal ring lytic transglycosylase RlpA family protein [Adhaeribacter swui]QNF32770.1 septal ring lytic transglycosylase RlpA family protein [Adhaeribacter swui]
MLFFKFRSWFFALVIACLFSSCVRNATSWKGYTEQGNASYYADKFQGKKMANGQPYRKGKLTAAHKKLPLGTRVKVTNPKNHRSVKVKITDRGPHTRGRILDLSRAAAGRLGIIQAGVAPVKLKVLKPKKSSS